MKLKATLFLRKLYACYAKVTINPQYSYVAKITINQGICSSCNYLYTKLFVGALLWRGHWNKPYGN